MANRVPLAVDEWYHCYDRGVDKRKVFGSAQDYRRFQALLFLANGDRAVHFSNVKDARFDALVERFADTRGNHLVEVGAYSLMPNHFHIILKEARSGGIASYMQKILTGYTMYFNKKNDRTGALFAGTFKSRHLHDDEYLKHAVSYVHLNPAELYEREWKKGVANLPLLEERLSSYQYSSLLDFNKVSTRSEKHILGTDIFDLYESLPTINAIVTDAQAYYDETNIKV